MTADSTHLSQPDRITLERVLMQKDQQIRAEFPNYLDRAREIADCTLRESEFSDLRGRYGAAPLREEAWHWLCQRFNLNERSTIGPIGWVPLEYQAQVALIRIPLVFGQPGQIPIHIDGVSASLIPELMVRGRQDVEALLLTGVEHLSLVTLHETAWRSIEPSDSAHMCSLGIENMRVSVDEVHKRRFGIGAFHAQQAGEMALKSLILHRAHPVQRTHNLHTLFNSVTALEASLADLERDLRSIDFPMGIRYGEREVGPCEAVTATQSAIRIVGRVARFISPTTMRSSSN